jgi:hypothetical protein
MSWRRTSAVASGIFVACLLAGSARAQDGAVVHASSRRTAEPAAQEIAYFEPAPQYGTPAPPYPDDDVTLIPSEDDLRLTQGDDAAEEPNPMVQDNGMGAEEVTPYDGGVYSEKPYLWGDLGGYCGGLCGCGFYAGVETTWLTVTNEPDNTVTLTNLVTGESATGSADPGVGAGVRYWFGLQHCGWGIVARHWHYENDETELDPDCPDFHGGPPIIIESYHLEADVFDLELTQRFCCCCWTLDTSFGGRYVDLERASLVSGIANIATSDPHTFVELTGTAFGANKLEGPGFTWSIRGTAPICCSPCWNWFWGYRGSLVWADCYCAAALTEATAVAKAPIGAIIAHSRDKAAATTTEDCDDVYINEVQLGVEYRHCMSCMPAICFIRAGLEYQNWQTGDFGAKSNSFAFVQGTPPPFGGRVEASSNAHDGDLDLIGVTVGFGLTY